MGRILESPVEPIEAAIPRNLGLDELIGPKERLVLPSSNPRVSPRMGSVNAVSSKASLKRRLFKLRYVAVAVVCGWAAFHYVTFQRPMLQNLEMQHAELASKLTQLKVVHQDLQKQVVELHSKQFIENYAASHMNLVMPGQVPFTIGGR